jgi:hypothetical protein
MKYQPGKFSIVPNRDYLCGKPPILQCLFLWLCVHSDEAGICFPSRKKLSEECNCDKRSIDKYMKVLEDDGVVKKTLRYNKRKKRNDSNLYQIMLNSEPITPPSESNVEKQGEPNDTVTITNNNYKQLTTTADAQDKPVTSVFDSKHFFEVYKSYKNPGLRVVGYYALRKGLWKNCSTEKQCLAIKGRLITVANRLGAFEDGKIIKVMDDLDDLTARGKISGWSLNAVEGRLANQKL